MASEWETKPLEDCMAAIIDYRGKSPNKTISGVPLVTAKIIKNGRILPPQEFIAEEDFDNWMRRGIPLPGDIVMTTEAPLGEVAQLDARRVALAQRVITLRGKQELLDNTFLKFLLQSSLVQDELRNRSTGTTVLGIRQSELRQVNLPLPPLSEQKRIAHVLGTLDDKIELNRKMNATLEAMSRAIFKSWFVDFDPVRQKAAGKQPVGMDAETAALFPDSFEDSELGEVPTGWEVCVLDDFTDFVIGGDWGKSEKTDREIIECACIRGADIPSLQGAGIGKMPIRYLKESSLKKRSLNPWDLVIEISGGSPTQSTGRPVMITDGLLSRLSTTLVASNFCRILKPKEQAYSPYIYYYLRHLYDSDVFLQYENGTTGIKNFAYKLFSEKHPIICPRFDVLSAYFQKVKTNISLQQENGRESRTLAALRDTLLPKLLSGEIRVPEAEEAVEEAVG